MSIDINLINKLGRSNSGNKKSVKNSKENINLTKNEKDINIASRVQKTVNVLSSSIDDGGTGIIKSGFRGSGVISAAVLATAGLANKSHNMYLSHRSASTGNTVHYENIKAGKDMLLSFGGKFISGWIQNELFTKQIIKRNNQSLTYGREVYNMNNFGEKYKTK